MRVVVAAAQRVAAANSARKNADVAYQALVTVYGVPLEVMLDSGSPVSIMSEDQLQRFDTSVYVRGPVPDDCPSFAGFAGGESRRPICSVMFPVNVTHSAQRTDEPAPWLLQGELAIKFYVFAESNVCLLGRDALRSADGHTTVFGHLLTLHINGATLDYRQALGQVARPFANKHPLNDPTTMSYMEVLYDPIGDPGGPDRDIPSSYPVITREFAASMKETQTDLPHPGIKDKLVDLVMRNADLFGPCPTVAESPAPLVHINVPPGRRIRTGMFRLCPPKHKQAAQAKCDKMEADDIIEYVDDPSVLVHIQAMVVIIKGDGTARVTLDLKEFNSMLEKHVTSLPAAKAFLERFIHCTLFSEIDVRDFFHVYGLDEPSRNLFGFRAPNGRYARYKRMPQGFHDAPGIAQRLFVADILAPFLLNAPRVLRGPTFAAQAGFAERHETGAYVDNNLHGTRPSRSDEPIMDTVDAHLAYVDLFLDYVRKGGGRLKVNNNTFCMRTGSSLGYVTDGVTISLDPSRLGGFAEMECPAAPTIKWARHIRGLFNHYADFVGTLEFAANLRKFTDVISESDRTGRLVAHIWGAEHTQAFYACRDAVSNAVSKYLPDFNRPFISYVDACDIGVSVTAGQYDDRGVFCPVLLWSYLWNTAQHCYDTKCQEAFAIILLIRKLGAMVAFIDLIIRTDHRNLLFMADSENRMLRRWWLEFAESRASLQHVSGDCNIVDSSSRVGTTRLPEVPLPAIRVVAAIVAALADSTWRYEVGQEVQYGGATVPWGSRRVSHALTVP